MNLMSLILDWAISLYYQRFNCKLIKGYIEIKLFLITSKKEFLLYKAIKIYKSRDVEKL